MEKLVRINIAVKPDANTARAAIDISRKLAREGETRFVLNNETLLPHITLYSPAFPSKNVPDVLHLTADAIKKHRAFDANVWTIRSSEGYIDAAFEITSAWKELHTDIVELLNPYREGYVRDKYQDEQELQRFSSQKQEYIRLYGYENVFDSFVPHLTFTRMNSESAGHEHAATLEFPLNSITVKDIAAYKMGPNGTCTEILKEYQLIK